MCQILITETSTTVHHDVYHLHCFLTVADGEDDGDCEDVVDGAVAGITPTVPSGTRESQLARRITKGKKTRRILSNKPQDFQVTNLLNTACCLFLTSLLSHYIEYF